MIRSLLVAAVALGLAGCAYKVQTPAPPRVEAPPRLPTQSSVIVVPVTTSLDQLQAALDQATPKTLWSIDQHNDACVPAQHIKVIVRLKVLPKLGCWIIGQVDRGPVTLSGRGDTLLISLPVRATISVRDVGGIIKRETATGAATIRAAGKLGIDGSWTPTAKVRIAYDWTDPPGIDFLGQRITFASKADAKLQGVIASLQRELPTQLAKLNLRARLADVWRQGFTSIELSSHNPPAWMRITPRRLGFGGYRIDGRMLTLTLSAEALTETFVGARPADPAPTPLPPPSRVSGAPGLRFYVPVLADYDQLEPVVGRALDKLARKGINLAGIGPVDARFGKVTVYATTGGRLAIGVDAKVKARNIGSLSATEGRIWLTALPVNQAGSQRIFARDVQLTAATDNGVVNLLLALFKDDTVQQAIQSGLTHDFAPDFQKVLGKAQRAIGERREGDFVLRSRVSGVKNGLIQATGAGLFLPISAEGQATISYARR